MDDVTVLPSYPSTSPNFPCVTFEELSNTTDTKTVDSSGEKYNVVSFEINIFSNRPNKESEVRQIRNRVDAIMSDEYGMGRDYANRTPNFADTNVHRYTLRYSFIIDTNKTIYRR